MKNEGTRILVIDDSPTVRRLSELILSQEGYSVHTAEDGERGLEVARRINPAAILVDFVMPKMNGHMFCKMLRSTETLKDIPVILISSKGEVVGQAFEEQFGIVHYFTKPFEPEELVQKLKDVLKTSQPTPVASSGESSPAPETAVITADLIETFQERFDKTITFTLSRISRC